MRLAGLDPLNSVIRKSLMGNLVNGLAERCFIVELLGLAPLPFYVLGKCHNARAMMPFLFRWVRKKMIGSSVLIDSVKRLARPS
jgi:hypothetical protein